MTRRWPYLRPLVRVLICSLLIVLVLSLPKTSSQAPLRLGLMGDSATDEYQGTDNRGGSYHAVTFNWMEHLVRSRGVDAGRWGTWSEPRRTGYEYNWARTGATAASLISRGQHTGLAAQVASGKIDLVFLSIGSNDFAPYYSSYGDIYNGTVSGTALQQKINAILANITLAVDTVRAAGSVPIVVTTIGDWGLSPLVQADARFQDAAKRQRVTNAIATTNAGIAQIVASRSNMALIDQNAFAQQFLSQLQNGVLMVSDCPLTVFSSGNEPHNGLLGDRIHAGTVMEGLVANYYLAAFNTLYSPGLNPLSDQEILTLAGLYVAPPATVTPTLTPSDTPSATLTDTPTPTVTDIPSETETLIPTATETPTTADTPTSLPAATFTDTPTDTPVPTDTPPPTDTPTFTPVPTDTLPPTDMPTFTPVPTNTPTFTPVPTDTPPPTDTPTFTPVPTDTPQPTDTPTFTPVPTNTPLPTDTPTFTPVPTDTPPPTDIPTFTPVPTNTPTFTPVPTDTPTFTPVPTSTPSAGTITLQIRAGVDDVNEDGSAFAATAPTIWLGSGQSAAASYLGLRFTNVVIPAGATITSARLEVYSSQAKWISYSFQFAGDASDNSAAFSTSSRPSQRSLTAARVNHTSNVNWNANTWYGYEDVRIIVQEIISRPGWRNGNSLSLVIKGTTGAWGRKYARSFEGGAATAARLVITYSS